MVRQLQYFLSRSLAAIVAQGCISNHHPSNYPLPSFPIDTYVVHTGRGPGDNDRLTIGDTVYCYYSKKLNNGDYLIIEDGDCDQEKKRVVILSKTGIVVSSDLDNLDEISQDNLEAMVEEASKK